MQYLVDQRGFINWDGVPIRIWDTAGIRKKAKVQAKLEKLSVSDGLRAVKFSEVVVILLVDIGFSFNLAVFKLICKRAQYMGQLINTLAVFC